MLDYLNHIPGRAMKRNKITIGCLSVVGVALGLFLLLNWLMFGDHSTYKSGLDKYEYLPETASDINVFTNLNLANIFICDFAMKEPEFKVFAQSNGWDVREIESPKELFTAASFNNKQTHIKHKIKNGLYYNRSHRNNGGISVAYDRDNGRGYIFRSSR